MTLFDEWRSTATELTWRSTTDANEGQEVRIAVHRRGTRGAPALVLVHGFPTSSIDFYALSEELSADFDIFLLDFPGYGLSDKPPAPYVYSLFDDGRLLVHAITDVWQLNDFTMLTHDRGDSVGLIALGMLSEAGAALPSDLLITNGNLYLPLANLTDFQKAALDPATGRATAEAVTPEVLAAGMGMATFMPRRRPDDPEIVALAQTFAHNDQIRVIPDTIQYLNERAEGETRWLEALAASTVQTTLVWGIHDNISPVRVANHVWAQYLSGKPGRNRYWLLPTADHYLQCDAPRQMAQIIRLTTEGTDMAIQTLDGIPEGAVLVY
ncbi:alpha/beta fold hydrolase [Streptomyces sp. NPDC048419]|uniref:alpha/beta fold hydrolase n=1 Tax=Streptomyces sp. NPDC048419 TaxID=3365547 RepID=UPI00371D8B61